MISDATNVIAEGEVLQLLNCHDPDIDEERYLQVIHYKTAKLFETASRLGAILGGATREVEDAMAEYGMRLGTAFQLIDDVLDYSGDHHETGKNVGDDLAEGKPTLAADLCDQAWRCGSRQGWCVMQSSRAAWTTCKACCRRFAIPARLTIRASRPSVKCGQPAHAISGLPDSKYKDSLLQLAELFGYAKSLA